ncbi:MAG: DUF6125 family protein [Thermoanaerobaculaceae bacterium]|nr:DUF6125 family protein [Thermoanaerobaculaceae bacterium]
MTGYAEMDRDQLIEALAAFAKNWLAHDGSWFLAAEERFGMATAIELDAAAWARFAPAEAKRALDFLGIPPGGGLAALEKVLGLRMYSLINPYRIEWAGDGAVLRFVTQACRVQQTRRRKGLPDFPCKSVGEVEFRGLAGAVDPRIRVRCVACPPDPEADGACAWEFSLAQGPEAAQT